MSLEQLILHASCIAVLSARCRWGLKTLLKYRTSRNYASVEFMAPRFADKVFIGLLVMLLYLNMGDNMDLTSMTNQASVLFM
jgi:hypothetical protein